MKFPHTHCIANGGQMTYLLHSIFKYRFDTDKAELLLNCFWSECTSLVGSRIFCPSALFFLKLGRCYASFFLKTIPLSSWILSPVIKTHPHSLSFSRIWSETKDLSIRLIGSFAERQVIIEHEVWLSASWVSE